MARAVELLREGRTQELWQKVCGFVDFGMDEFMAVQRRLLLEQMDLLGRCELGRAAMGGARPRTVEEFRDEVPITTYEQYAPFLLEHKEDALPEAPLLWQRTSGRSGEYPFKSVPTTKRLYEELGDGFLAVLIFATCNGRGDVVLEEHDKFLYGLAPPPYASGCWARRADEEGIFEFLPPIAEAEQMEFEERIRQGFMLGMAEGIDMLAAVTSILVAIGEQLGQGGGLKSAIGMLSKPRLLPRLVRAMIKSKLARRRMLPRDIWSIKGLVSVGTDAAVYREKIKEMWGKYPLDVYGSAESTIVALQTWDCGHMTFYPFINFLEFVPEDECRKWLADRAYRPTILTLDQVEAGERYAIVVTNFLGGPFVRYFIGDVIRIASIGNEALGIATPQMVFDSRLDGLINLAGFTRLTEKVIWQAIENSGVPYHDWAVRKEVGDREVLHLFVELKPGNEIWDGRLAGAIDAELQKLDKDYADLEKVLGLQPLEVTILPEGAFQGYMARQREAGADLAHLKPPHMNPPDAIVEQLMAATESRELAPSR